MIFWILFLAFVTFVWGFGSACGFSVGYRRGVQETVKLNDAAYRSKLAADVEAARLQNENYTREVKARVTHQIEEFKRAGLTPLVVAPVQPQETTQDSTQVQSESGKVIEFPHASVPDKPVA